MTYIDFKYDFFRTSISRYRKDQEYCKEGLRLLTLLASQFGRRQDVSDDDMNDAQSQSLHLLKAFWCVMLFFVFVFFW